MDQTVGQIFMLNIDKQNYLVFIVFILLKVLVSTVFGAGFY